MPETLLMFVYGAIMGGLVGFALGQVASAKGYEQRMKRLDELQDRTIEHQKIALRRIEEYNRKLAEG